MENAVHVLDRLGGQPLFVLQGVVHGLDHGGRELAKLGLSDIGDDIQLHMVGIGLDRGRLDISDVVPEPDGEPFGKLDGIRFNIGAFVDLTGDLGKLLADFLLRFAVDRLLNQLAGLGIKAVGIPGLPAPVRSLADVSGTVCVFSRQLYLSFYRMEQVSIRSSECIISL